MNCEYKAEIIESLSNIGIFVNLEDCDKTILLSDLIEDSLMFISFIVEIESRFNVEIPDEYLLMSVMETLNDVSNVISELKL